MTGLPSRPARVPDRQDQSFSWPPNVRLVSYAGADGRCSSFDTFCEIALWPSFLGHRSISEASGSDFAIGAVKYLTEPPDCGLLHDNMSLPWGKFKDLVDELQAEMDKSLFGLNVIEMNMNSQLEVLPKSK